MKIAILILKFFKGNRNIFRLRNQKVPFLKCSVPCMGSFFPFSIFEGHNTIANFCNSVVLKKVWEKGVGFGAGEKDLLICPPNVGYNKRVHIYGKKCKKVNVL